MEQNPNRRRTIQELINQINADEADALRQAEVRAATRAQQGRTVQPPTLEELLNHNPLNEMLHNTRPIQPGRHVLRRNADGRLEMVNDADDAFINTTRRNSTMSVPFMINSTTDPQLNMVPDDVRLPNDIQQTIANCLVVDEYANSRLKLRENEQFRHAIYPYFHPWRSVEIITRKPNVATAGQFNHWADANGVMRRLIGEDNDGSMIRIMVVNIDGSNETEAILKNMDEQFGFDMTTCGALVLTPYHTVRVYGNKHENQNTIVVLTNTVNHGLFLKILAILPRFCPCLESEKLQITYPYEMLAYLGAFDHEKYWRMYADWVKTIIEQRRRTLVINNITNHVSNLGRRQESTLQEQLRTVVRNRDNLFAQYRNELIRESELQDKLFVLQHRNNDSHIAEFIDYVKRVNDIVYATSLNENVLFLVAQVPASIFDIDEVQTMMNSSRANIVNSHKNFFNKCFIEQTHTLYFHVAFVMDFINNNVGKSQFPQHPEYIVKGCPNPHIYNHNCWGDNHAPIVKALRDKDYIVALVQALSACRGLNFSDGTVLRNWEPQLAGETWTTRYPAVLDKATGEWSTITQLWRA